jgi:serine/threonine protein kinase/WD40 repeat protein
MNEDQFAERLVAYEAGGANGAGLGGGVDGREHERLAEAFECVDLLNRVWGASWRGGGEDGVEFEIEDAAAVGGASDTICDPLETTREQPLRAAIPLESTVQRIGRFQIIRLLGQGGSGIVFLAQDTELRRHVALKVPRPETLLTPELRRRFLQEGRAAAALSHPGIVPVYDAGSLGPVCYIASEYCAGPTLAQWLSERKGVPFRLAAEWTALLADAVEHAHERGVLHRDLKPGNILLAPRDSSAVSTDGEPERTLCEPSDLAPRITDFGLAKLQSSDATATRTGALLGTAAYMAPEQVEGRTTAIDRRTDVYGLGAILYELITSAPPFREATDIATLVAVRQLDPARPSELRAGLPPDLEAICLTCLEKEPGKRYLSASSLAADLRRFLAGEPTLVRPLGPLKRSIKWVARHRLLSGLIAVVLVSALVVTSGSAWHAHRLSQELATSDQLRTRAQKRESEYREILYAADMRFANQALLDNDAPRAVELLDAHVPAAGEEDKRDFEWHLLRRKAVGEHTVLDDVGTPTYDLAFAPDDRRLATVGKDSRLRVYEWPSGKLLSVIDTGQKGNNGLAFSEDSATIATAGEDGTVKFWKNATAFRTLKAHAGRVRGILYYPPHSEWITWADEPEIRVWSASTGASTGVLSAHQGSVTAMTVSRPTKYYVGSIARDATLRVWDMDAKKQMWILTFPSRATCFSFAGQNDAMIVGLVDGQVKRWPTIWPEGKELPAITPVPAASSAAFSPDGFRLAVGNRLGAIWIWRPAGGRPARAVIPKFLSTLKAHSGAVTEVLYDSKSNYLLSIGEDGRLIRWPAAEDRLYRRYDVGDLGASIVFMIARSRRSQVRSEWPSWMYAMAPSSLN